MEADIEAGGRGVEGDERFHGAVTDGGALAAARAADGRDRRPDQGDPDRVAVAARPAARLAGRAPGDRRRHPRAATPRPPRRRCTPTSPWSATSRCCASPARDSDRLGGSSPSSRAGFGAGILTSTVGRRVAAELPGAAGGRAAARGGQRVQHRRDDPGRAERVVRLPARAARAPARSPRSCWSPAPSAPSAGALLLLALPPGVFEAVVPWLILVTSVLVGIQPWISRRLRARRGADAPDRVQMSPVTTAWATLTACTAATSAPARA